MTAIKNITATFGTVPEAVTKADGITVVKVGNIVFGTFLIGVNAVSGNINIPITMTGLRVKGFGVASFNIADINGVLSYNGTTDVISISAKSATSSTRCAFVALVIEQ